MIKLMLLVRRKAGTDRDAFRRYYETIHAPLAGSIMVRCKKYVRNFVREDVSAAMDFDVVTEFWFDVDGPWEKARDLLSDAATDLLLEDDERRFMDRDSMRVFTVEECESDASALLGNVTAVKDTSSATKSRYTGEH